MDSGKASNKIMEVVRLQQMLKKWKELAITRKRKTSKTSIKLLKKTFSFSETSSSMLYSSVPKGYLALCVGEEMKRFVIPMEYLENKAFQVLLQEVEAEFGFQNDDVLRIPCQVSIFEAVIKKMMGKKKKVGLQQCSSKPDLRDLHHLRKRMCR